MTGSTGVCPPTCFHWFCTSWLCDFGQDFACSHQYSGDNISRHAVKTSWDDLCNVAGTREHIISKCGYLVPTDGGEFSRIYGKHFLVMKRKQLGLHTWHEGAPGSIGDAAAEIREVLALPVTICVSSSLPAWWPHLEHG